MSDLNLRINAMPEGLDEQGQAAYRAIVSLLEAEKMTYTGGCTTFYSPKQWRERGEKYGCESKLIVVYDGGEVRPFFEPETSYDVRYSDKMKAALRNAGVYSEGCTCVYSAIYAR